MERLLLSAALGALAVDSRALLNCTTSSNDTSIISDEDATSFNITASSGNDTCLDLHSSDGSITVSNMGMVKVGVLTAVLLVVMISTCRLLFKMYAQFGMRDSEGNDKVFGE